MSPGGFPINLQAKTSCLCSMCLLLTISHLLLLNDSMFMCLILAAHCALSCIVCLLSLCCLCCVLSVARHAISCSPLHVGLSSKLRTQLVASYKWFEFELIDDTNFTFSYLQESVFTYTVRCTHK